MYNIWLHSSLTVETPFTCNIFTLFLLLDKFSDYCYIYWPKSLIKNKGKTNLWKIFDLCFFLCSPRFFSHFFRFADGTISTSNEFFPSICVNTLLFLLFMRFFLPTFFCLDVYVISFVFRVPFNSIVNCFFVTVLQFWKQLLFTWNINNENMGNGVCKYETNPKSKTMVSVNKTLTFRKHLRVYADMRATLTCRQRNLQTSD